MSIICKDKLVIYHRTNSVLYLFSGQKFAMMEMKIVLAAIVKNFKLISANMEPDLCSDLILRSENGVKVKLVPRNNTVM